MVAVPFTQTLILKGRNGRVIHHGLTVSDVVNEYAIAPSGDAFVQVPSDQDYSIVDLIVVVGGTDTNFQQLFINGLDSGIKVSNKSNLNTANFRQFLTAPITVRAGSLLKFKQTA